MPDPCEAAAGRPLRDDTSRLQSRIDAGVTIDGGVFRIAKPLYLGRSEGGIINSTIVLGQDGVVCFTGPKVPTFCFNSIMQEPSA